MQHVEHHAILKSGGLGFLGTIHFGNQAAAVAGEDQLVSGNLSS